MNIVKNDSQKVMSVSTPKTEKAIGATMDTIILQAIRYVVTMLILAPSMSATDTAAEAVGASTVTKAPCATISSNGLIIRKAANETTTWNNNSQTSNRVSRIVFTSRALNEK